MPSAHAKPLIFLLLVTTIIYSDAAPVETCAEGANCIHFVYGDCDNDEHRLVCMIRSAGFADTCVKASHEGLSHACPINECGNSKIQSWLAQELCVEADAGGNASFAFKDGGGCQVFPSSLALAPILPSFFPCLPPFLSPSYLPPSPSLGLGAQDYWTVQVNPHTPDRHADRPSGLDAGLLLMAPQVTTGALSHAGLLL